MVTCFPIVNTFASSLEKRAAPEEAERRERSERAAREELEQKLAKVLAALEQAKQP